MILSRMPEGHTMLLPTRAQEEGDGKGGRIGLVRPESARRRAECRFCLRVERGEIFSDAGKKKAEWTDGGVVVAYKTRQLPGEREENKKSRRKGVTRRNEKGKTMLDNCFSLQIVTSSTIRRWAALDGCRSKAARMKFLEVQGSFLRGDKVMYSRSGSRSSLL